tara:strand:+ start:365 stop:664 length:300 start_codon:yes stop_codon:yes gene_type:complete
MKEAPEPVLLYIPLMKELNFSWNEIKNTPHVELEGLLLAFSEYSNLHSYDGYNDEDISSMSKGRPEVRSQYTTYLQTKRKYYKGAEERKVRSFKEALNL